MPEVAKLVDLSRCTGCKGCEVACKVWNELSVEPTTNFGSYQSHKDLSPTTWLLLRFAEIDVEGQVRWLIRGDACHHCQEPACLLNCPAPGAIIQYENGAVVYREESCIGCGTCVAVCPFRIPRLDPEAAKARKCSFCIDRIEGGLEPACAKTCPSGAISFGTRDDMLSLGRERVSGLEGRGLASAVLYDPPGVGGSHMIFLVPFGEHLADYGLPADPQVISGARSLLRDWASVGAGLGGLGLLGAATRLMMAPQEPASGDEAARRVPKT
ncbi:MAG: 4Fe-4S dicluster domain-containing protein [Candidatus Bipolaricaulota bacterium]